MEPRASKRLKARESPVPTEPVAGCSVETKDHGRHVLVSCFDEPLALTEVDLRVLEPFETRLAKIIRYDQPEVVSYGPHKGKPYWRTGMTKAMLSTLIRSLMHGELSVGKGVSISEALTTFEYENVPVGVPASEQRRLAAKSLQNAGAGVSKDKRSRSVQEIVLKTCEQIAHALAVWPRLENALDAAIAGSSTPCTCTATRVWIKFIPKPQLVMEKSEKWLSIARKWQTWCSATMASIGVQHAKLAADGAIDAKARTAPSHALLVRAVETHPLGNFFMIQNDAGKTRVDPAVSGEAFASEMRLACISDRGGTGPVVSTAPEGAAQPDKNAPRYARACMALSENIFHSTPNLAMLYSSACMDEAGKTPERVQLTKSLKSRGITVVRWCDSDSSAVVNTRPLVFPPHWRDDRAPHGSSQHTSLPMVLLDFSAIR